MKKQILFLVFILNGLMFVSAQIPPQMAFNETANRLTVTNGLSLWFDAADMGSIVKDAGNKVSLWQDKSGNNNHAVQGTAANQPSYTGFSLNTLPVVYFSSSAVAMVGTKNGNYQTIIAVRNVAGNSYQTLFAAPANSDYSVRLGGGYNNTTGNTAYNGDNNGNDWAKNSTSFPNVKFVNGVNTPQIPVNPTYHIIVTNSPNLVSNDTFSLSSSFMSRGMTGGIAEFIVFNRIITAVERRSIEQYLARKWKISITPALIVP